MVSWMTGTTSTKRRKKITQNILFDQEFERKGVSKDRAKHVYSQENSSVAFVTNQNPLEQQFFHASI